MSDSPVKVTLEEGKYYPFTITGSVILPDGSESYILTDINKVKHLLNKGYYRHYQFKLNQQINCRIDKINCTGKIYIEPEHPYYKLGESYEFRFSRYKSMKSPGGQLEQLAVLKNGLNEDIYLAADEIEQLLNPGDHLTAIVERIKKGRVYITVGSSVNDYTGMEAGKKYRFTLTKEFISKPEYTYYVLADENKKEFRIRKKFYEKYGFTVGEQVSCELMETDHQVFLEPLHPYYEIGFNYQFRVLGETIIDEYPEMKKEAYVLENKYGRNIYIKKEDVGSAKIVDGQIKCTVLAIKKSQVFVGC